MTDSKPQPARLDATLDSARALEEAVRVLRRGGIIVFPTDTLYGLGADPLNPAAVDRLYAIKQRPAKSPMTLIAAGQEQIETCVGELSELARRLAEQFWPGPLTLIVRARPELARNLHSPTGCVGVRVPAHELARSLALRFGRPLTATSANRTGEPAPSRASELSARLAQQIDLVLDAGATAGGPPSTIVDASGARIRLVRPGAVAWERVLESLAGVR